VFEAAELGRSVDKKAFESAERELRTELLEAQRSARAAGLPVIVIVSGVEGAGKGGVVNRLRSWLDPRGVDVQVFWDETDEERERPNWWRFWRALPPRGGIGVLFGSWYTKPIVDVVFGKTDDAAFRVAMHDIVALERMLTLDGALIVKLWFHLSQEAQGKRYDDDMANGRPWKVSPLTEEYGKSYKAFRRVSEQAIGLTDTGLAPWHLIEATNERYRDLTAGQTLLAAMRSRLSGAVVPTAGSAVHVDTGDVGSELITVLDRVDLVSTIKSGTYKAELAKWQRCLNLLSWKAYKRGTSTVAVFEGWDASGKGGVIRRLMTAVDARLARVIPIAAPTDEEAAQHYLWRFWRHIPRAGRLTLYDRSWYGRVLVERVEGYATEAEWRRSYHEINTFEEQLRAHGVVMCKFWLHISPEEQLRRFEERKATPWKAHKITEDDWRNRERWDDYRLAVNDMVQRTSTTAAPWSLVPANDKKRARIQVIRTVCERLASELGEDIDALLAKGADNPGR
jgi:polyphosphate:AMP phosphotransferase